MVFEPKEITHRPWATHFHEKCKPTKFITSPENIKVKLVCTNGTNKKFFANVYKQLEANFGNTPLKKPKSNWDMTNTQWDVIKNLFKGHALSQVLENMTFSFRISGISRACTHQLVRSRIGASFMQHGGRDNDWRHMKQVLPETINRAMHEKDLPVHLTSCVVTEDAIYRFHEKYKHYLPKIKKCDDVDPLDSRLLLELYYKFGVEYMRNLYSMLVDIGIPYQDARQVMPIGTSTYLFANYNWIALSNFISKRLEFCMDWQINCVAQLMKREVHRKYKKFPWVGEALISMSDKLGRSAFAGMDGWPPDQKYKLLYDPSTKFRVSEQMPFWVLDQKCYKDPKRKVKWYATNGSYPNNDGKIMDTDLRKNAINDHESISTKIILEGVKGGKDEEE